MKTKRLITLVVAICLIVVFAAMLLKQHHPPITEHETSSDATSSSSASNSAASITTQSKTAVKAEVSSKTNAVSAEVFSMKIMDSKTGHCALVGLDRKTITLKDKNGSIIWTVDLAKEASKRGWQHLEGIEFGAFNEKRPILWVEVVNASFELDLNTGKIIGIGGGRMHNP